MLVVKKKWVEVASTKTKNQKPKVKWLVFFCGGWRGERLLKSCVIAADRIDRNEDSYIKDDDGD